jgi:hypothetical protein
MQIQYLRTHEFGHETEIILKKIKKTFLTRVQMPKLTTLILRPRYLHKNHIKTNYKTQYTINQVLIAGIREKNTNKIKSIQIYILNTILKSLDQDNIMQSKNKLIMKSNFKSSQYK